MEGGLNDHMIEAKKASRLLVLWTLRAHRAASAHYSQSIIYRRQNMRLTCLNAFFSILILFLATRMSANAQDLQDIANGFIDHWGIGISSAFLVVLGVVQFIMRLSERQGEHREAGQEFSNLQRKIERYSLYSNHNMAQVHNISREYNHITKSYPLVDRGVWIKSGKDKLVQQIIQLEDELRGVDSNFGRSQAERA